MSNFILRLQQQQRHISQSDHSLNMDATLENGEITAIFTRRATPREYIPHEELATSNLKNRC